MHLNKPGYKIIIFKYISYKMCLHNSLPFIFYSLSVIMAGYGLTLTVSEKTLKNLKQQHTDNTWETKY